MIPRLIRVVSKLTTFEISSGVLIMRNEVVFFVLLSMLFFVGCGTTGKFVYPDQMTNLVQMGTEPMLNKTVAVVPLDDYRSNENSCWYPLYLIPLIPMGWDDYERPDAASTFLSILKYDVTPQEDLAKAAAVSLRHSNLFQDAFFTIGGEKKNADFVLSWKNKNDTIQSGHLCRTIV